MKFWCLLILIPSLGAHASQVYDFTYKTEFAKAPAGSKSWEAWIPFPAEGPDQKVLSYKINCAAKYEITKGEFGNRMIHLKTESADVPANLTAEYKIERSESSDLPLSRANKFEGWNPHEALGANRRIPLAGRIEKLGAEKTAGARSSEGKIKMAYRYVVETMAYNKDGKGWGEGDAIWACDNKRGNCTDFHSLFIGMVRSQGIPAKFEIGFPVPPGGEGVIPGYHCWAWAYTAATGWEPLDASEAKQHHQMFEFLGHLPSDRVMFTTGRDLVLNPAQHGEPLNFFIYPYLEVDGVKSDGFTKGFSVRKAG